MNIVSFRVSLVATCAGFAVCSHALAEEPILANDGLGQATPGGYVYVNARTGERSISTTPIVTRSDFVPIFVNRDVAANGNHYYFTERPGNHNIELSNWADIPFDSAIDAYAFAYATSFVSSGEPPVDPNVNITHWWWDCDGGFNDDLARPLWSITISDLQNNNTGSTTTAQFWIYVIDLGGSGLEFEIGDTDGSFTGTTGEHSTGCDKDDEHGDPLADFSWSYAFSVSSFESEGSAGPLLVLPAEAANFEDDGIPTGADGDARGDDDAFDLFRSPVGESRGTYLATLWFGGWPGAPYASTYMGLYGSNPRDCGPADFNADTLVDILDFLDFIDDFSNCEGQPAPCGSTGNADLGGDTIVDILDFLDFFDVFSACE